MRSLHEQVMEHVETKPTCSAGRLQIARRGSVGYALFCFLLAGRPDRACAGPTWPLRSGPFDPATPQPASIPYLSRHESSCTRGISAGRGDRKNTRTIGPSAMRPF